MSHLVGLHAIDGNRELSASPFDSYHQLKQRRRFHHAQFLHSSVKAFSNNTLQLQTEEFVPLLIYLKESTSSKSTFSKSGFFFSQSTAFSKHAAKKLVNANIALMAAPVQQRLIVIIIIKFINRARASSSPKNKISFIIR